METKTASIGTKLCMLEPTNGNYKFTAVVEEVAVLLVLRVRAIVASPNQI